MATLKANQPSKNAMNFFTKAEATMTNLAGRWLDESKYEDINDYKKPLIPIAKKTNCEIVKMNKRPFGCNFTTDGRTYVLKISGTRYEYKRIA